MEDRPRDGDTDDDLIERSRRGDERAFAVLVGRHQQVAFRAAYVITGDADAAADAAQEGFIAVHRALGQFRSGEPFRPWLLRIVGNRARNLRRGAGRRSAATLRMAALPVAPVESPEAELAAAEKRRRVLDAVNRLGAEDRAALACRYFLDMSEAETAELLGIRRGTVKSRLSRARDRLRVRLVETEEVDGG